MMGKISGAINNPIVGVFSYRICSLWVRHLPWMSREILPFVFLYGLHCPSVYPSEDVAINQSILFVQHVFNMPTYYALIIILFLRH